MRLYPLAFVSLALAATPPALYGPTDRGAGDISNSDLAEAAYDGTAGSELNDSEERLHHGSRTESLEETSTPPAAESAGDGAEATAAALRAAERQRAHRQMQAQQATARRVAAQQRRQQAHRQMQAQQAAARRVAAQQRAAQHRRNQQR